MKEEGIELSTGQLRLLSDIQLEVALEVGQIILSAEQLLDLHQGQVFEVELDEKLPVTLRIGGEMIAEARFVLSDEQLALEILALPPDIPARDAGTMAGERAIMEWSDEDREQLDQPDINTEQGAY